MSRPHRSTLVAVAWLTTPVLGFILPLYGVFASAGAAFPTVSRTGPVLWTGDGWPRSRPSAVIAGFAALWLLPFRGRGMNRSPRLTRAPGRPNVTAARSTTKEFT